MRRLIGPALVVLTIGLGLVVVGGGAGCGGSGGAPAATAGLPEATLLNDLTDKQRGQLCDWMVAKAGIYGTPGSPGSCAPSSDPASSPFFAYIDQMHCIADAASATATPGCQAKVQDLEACIDVLPRCPTATDLAAAMECAALSDC